MIDAEGVKNMLDLLVGETVSQVRVDYNFTILVHTEAHGGVLIMANGHVALASSVGGESQIFDLEDKESAVGTLVDSCRFAEIAGAKIEPDGRFCIDFSSGSQLASIIDDDYESWELNAESGLKIVCRAGGEIVTWAAEQGE